MLKGVVKLFAVLAVTATVGLLTNHMAQAQSVPTNNLYINEIAWMGTTTSGNDEWIELFNPTDQSIDLTDWVLLVNDTEIVLEASVGAQSFFLLERTDDESVVGIVADQIYSGSLSNSGGSLELKNAQGQSIQVLNFVEGWPAGDNTTKQTMSLGCDAVWETSVTVNGTPKASNGDCDTGDDNQGDDQVGNDDATNTQCTATEISRTCVFDGIAEVLYSYNSVQCDDDYAVQESSTACACQYTDWQDMVCAEPGIRTQTRQEVSGNSYCSESLEQEVNDASCEQQVEEPDYTVQGEGCIVVNFAWECSNQTIEVYEDTESSKLSLNLTELGLQKELSISRTRKGRLFDLYRLSGEKQWGLVFVNHITNELFVRGLGVSFRGSIQQN